MAIGLSRLLVLLALLTSLGSCSSPPPPQIDRASFRPLVLLDAGVRAGVGTVEAHAASGTITQLVLRFVPSTQHGLALYEGPPLETSGESSPYEVTLAFEASAPLGDYSLEITAIDSNGDSSSPVIVDVSVE